MHIAILGAERLGIEVAERLKNEGHTVVLVDSNQELLNEIETRLDIKTKCSSCSDPRLLGELIKEDPAIVLALTGNDEVNLIASSCVKQLKNLSTVVRLKDPKFFQEQAIDLRRLFHIDNLVVPELLVAEEIANSIFTFGKFNKSYFHGGVLVRTIQVPEGSPMAGKSVWEIRSKIPSVIIGLIHRPKEVLAEDFTKQMQLVGKGDLVHVPHGNDVVLQEDELLLIGESEAVFEAFSLFGVELELPKSIYIVGATEAGIHLARLLHEKGMHVTIGDSSAIKLQRCAKELPHVRIRQYEAEHIDYLKNESIDSFDVFVACTEHEEGNMLLGMLANDLGAARCIVMLRDEMSVKLAAKEGIASVIAPELVAADRIANFALQGKLISLDSLFDGRAEIIHAKVSLDSPLAGIPLSVLGPKLPREVLIGVIYTRGRIYIASGNHILLPRDEVIVLCHPKHRALLEKLL